MQAYGLWRLAAAHLDAEEDVLLDEDEAPPAPICSVTVLSLCNTSGDPANEYFSDGMSESFIASLFRIEGPKVISRGCVIRYKGKEADPREADRQIGVAAAPEGSVWKNGARASACSSSTRRTAEWCGRASTLTVRCATSSPSRMTRA